LEKEIFTAMDHSPDERIRHSQGKIARIKKGLPYFASIVLTIYWPAQDFSIVFDCHGEGWIRQGTIEEVSAEGYDDWKQGALAGIRYALTKCNTLPCRINITSIMGLTTDTNPTIVAGAAIQAVWAGTEYEPSVEENAFVEQLVFQSWMSHFDSIPDFDV
jgi:hypothetical protein